MVRSLLSVSFGLLPLSSLVAMARVEAKPVATLP